MDTLVEQQESIAEPAPLAWTAVIHDWITTVDHKKIGIMYILMAVVFLIIGGCEAVLIRMQLFWPRSRLIGPDTFNGLFTMHGTTMVFFMGMPILIGIANYMVPLMIGARDMAFPRLNALGFWATLFGGLLVYFSFVTGALPFAGWFAYAPMTEHAYARGPAMDFWALGLLVSGIGTIAAAVNFVATIMGLRAPGMSIRMVPFFVWTILWTSVLILFAIPPLTASLVMILLDRNLGAHFFDVQNGGSAFLWQHLFWFFGHPEVYILILPVFGMISEVVPVFSRKVLFGYEFMAAATAAITFISLGVWAHHMFTVGMSRTANLYFAAASLLISIPTGIKFFNWLATMYGGKISFAPPMLFAFGFLSMFLIGGLTGIMLAVVPFDFQVTDSYFVVGHFHWVLIGGTLFGTLAGIHYWYPKATGRMLSVRLGLLAVLAPVHRLHLDLWADAHLGDPGHAPPDLHLRRGPGLDPLESVNHSRRDSPGPEFRDLRLQPDQLLVEGQAGRGRPVGCVDARVGDDLSAATLQLRGDSDRAEPPPPLGRETRGRPGLEIRMRKSRS